MQQLAHACRRGRSAAYLWTGTGPIGTVRTELLTVRRGPGGSVRGSVPAC